MNAAAANAAAPAANNAAKPANNAAKPANNGTRKNNAAAPANANKPLSQANLVGGGKMKTVGTKAQVFHGTAKHTSGGLTKKDLMKTKKGRIVSRKKHAAGKKALKQLVKAGYKAKKGTFKLFRK